IAAYGLAARRSLLRRPRRIESVRTLRTRSEPLARDPLGLTIGALTGRQQPPRLATSLSQAQPTPMNPTVPHVVPDRVPYASGWRGQPRSLAGPAVFSMLVMS